MNDEAHAKRNAAILAAIADFTARMVQNPDACRDYLAAMDHQEPTSEQWATAKKNANLRRIPALMKALEPPVLEAASQPTEVDEAIAEIAAWLRNVCNEGSLADDVEARVWQD